MPTAVTFLDALRRRWPAAETADEYVLFPCGVV